MRSTIFLVPLLLASFAAQGAESGRPSGANCTREAPPESAGEESNHGTTLRIYPRAREIDSKYTGCQLVWAPNGEKWTIVSVVAIEGGDPVRVWVPDDSSSELLACRYKNGKVVAGDADNCAVPEFLIMKSLAPGCVAKLRKTVAEGGIRAPWPKGCSYE